MLKENDQKNILIIIMMMIIIIIISHLAAKSSLGIRVIQCLAYEHTHD
jgi:hypothetical protein